MKLIVAFSLFFTASVFALPVEGNLLQARIAGGQVAKPNEFPYQIGLYVTDGAQTKGGIVLHTWCGGSLISEEYVLTAAHCLIGSLKAVVLLGAHNVMKHEELGRTLLPVEKESFIIHPNYDPYTSDYDIALIKLPGKIQLTNKVQLINLPKPSQVPESLEGHQATVTGWGKMGDNANTSDVLRYTQLKVIKDRVCKFYYPDTYKTATNICVESKGKSVCPGDSGGPLVIDEIDGSKTVIGITSHVRLEGCQEGFPTVFTRVSAFLDWISKHTNIQK